MEETEVGYSVDYDRIMECNGYLAIYAPDHPKVWPKGYVYLHRVVVEDDLGRILRDNEVIHHKNGDTQDNRLENLEVLADSEHSSRHAKLSGRKWSLIKCPECCEVFSKKYNQTAQGKGEDRLNFCSRSCASKFHANDNDFEEENVLINFMKYST